MLAYQISPALSFLLLSYLFESIYDGELLQGGRWIPGSSLLSLTEGIRDLRNSLVTFAFIKPEMLLVFLLVCSPYHGDRTGSSTEAAVVRKLIWKKAILRRVACKRSHVRTPHLGLSISCE